MPVISFPAVLTDYKSISFEQYEGNIELILKYDADDWDTISSPSSSENQAHQQLEKLLKDLQTGRCINAPICYSQHSEPTPLYELYYVIIRVPLCAAENVNDIIGRLRESELNIPQSEILSLMNTHGKKEAELISHNPPPRKNRWASIRRD